MADESKTEKWFRDNVEENKKEIEEIGALASYALHEKISLGVQPKTTMAVYAIIFRTICKAVAAKESDWDTFFLNIADRLRIGFTTTSNEDDEKAGNFMVFIQHMENTQTDESLDEEESSTIALCTQWNAANVKDDSNIIKDIAGAAVKALSDVISIKSEAVEIVIPMFCIIHSQIIKYIKLKRVEGKELGEYEINVCGLYTVGVRLTDDAEEEVYFIPSVDLKLLFKNDAQATGKNE